MEVFNVIIYYKEPQGIKLVNLAAACPTGEHLLPQRRNCETRHQQAAHFQQVASFPTIAQSPGMCHGV